GWQRDLRYEKSTLVTDVRLRNENLGIEMRCADCVDFHRPIYLRRIAIKNLRSSPRDVRIFFHQDFNVYGDEIGDTAYFDPEPRSLIHYKRKLWFWIDVQTRSGFGWDDFAIGESSGAGLEGTWRDAENGELGGNLVSQGAVDSTGATHLKLDGDGSDELYYWISVDRDYKDLREHNDSLRERGAESLINRTRHYWRFWVTGSKTGEADLDQRLTDLYHQSLLIVRTQVDNGGAIIAANDTDNLQFNRDVYSYMWPRDGALVADALGKAEFGNLTQQFYTFCAGTIRAEGFMAHKYGPDGSEGSSWHPWATASGELQLPIQEDETALVLWALGRQFDRDLNVEAIKPLYAELIKKAADFLCEFRDPETGLPSPSYDLWEERHGVHAWTVASVWAGLRAAAAFARGFGETEVESRYRGVADSVRDAAERHLYDETEGRFLRRIVPNDSGGYEKDMVLDASLYGLFYFGMFSADDPRIVATMTRIKDRLWVRTDVGGIARYENDYYHQVSTDVEVVPGNPWFICTMWLAQWYVATATKPADLAPAKDLMNWVVDRALPSGTLAEQINPYSNAPLSVSPLTWSHATYIGLFREYLIKYRELTAGRRRKQAQRSARGGAGSVAL
ncbi:MAG: glycoside hydrolase family 15 protein, partial [Gammaproteobacteria bacterium]|nr:glycoside hydrolase family 15 protein [Gammaproteobacteria bacterium]